ncbi:hypothetical protein NE852_02570 [Rhizobium sp. Pop5]|uniref:hypothetical protein n=1 Tax=Rhizobium sp. Pop5 TaxID=1223565 RepID=UPI00028355B3|nr:hypothetical protein [Rhizobium sp. Pop5]EJZ22298.1 hypothetical protein RCCGEPOP_05519 [Rhizobium sp. Pop5]UVD57117.1 hypothetical protein NE852_02570 [Rhizobium sp. Pop5]
MSKDESPAPKKSFLERMTGTTAQITALLIAVTALLTQIPSLTKTGRDAVCSVLSCSEIHDTQSPTDSRPDTPLPSGDSNNKLQALEAAGISRGTIQPDWLNNEYSPYPFIGEALLKLLDGKRLVRPITIDTLVGTYEYQTTSPRSAAEVDIEHLKASVVMTYNETYGETQSDFQALLRTR